MQRQTPYAGFPSPCAMEWADAAANRVISLPMHAYPTPVVRDVIIAEVNKAAA